MNVRCEVDIVEVDEVAVPRMEERYLIVEPRTSNDDQIVIAIRPDGPLITVERRDLERALTACRLAGGE